MDINDLKKEVKQDLAIDELQLDLEALNIPSLFTKYQGMLLDIKGDLQSAMEARDRIVKIRTDYYLGRAEDKVYAKEPLDHKILKSDLSTYLNSDHMVIEAKSVVALYSRIAEFLEGVLWDIKRRNEYIRAAIDWRKFNEGM